MEKLILILLLCLSGDLMGQSPKNVIIMIGDGMGINQIQMAYTRNGGALNMLDRCPYMGLRRTDSANSYTTDSAAGGTAIATGRKTNNGMVGMSPDSIPMSSIVCLATQEGLSSGVIATSSLTDATPASFVAHQPLRYMQEEIAADYSLSDITLFIGGGRKYFEQRKDGRNISEELRGKGYHIVYDLDEANKISGKMGILLADDGMKPVSQRPRYLLADMTELAIEKLSENKKGFVLMVEGSQIDWGGHNNDQNWMVEEVLDFDYAIGRVLDFAEKDGNTLVLITADHETGGVAVQSGDYAKEEASVRFTTGGHTASPVPLFAYGPGAELFTGFKDNTSSFYLIKELLKLK